jgi:hypothetical protein
MARDHPDAREPALGRLRLQNHWQAAAPAKLQRIDPFHD